MGTHPTGTNTAAGGVPQDSGVEVVLHAQELRLSTQRVATERVRFTKRIVTTTRTIDVPVRVEQLVVSHERLPAGTPPADGGTRSEGDEFVIVLHEEVPEVTLRVLPVERVSVGVRTVSGEQVVTAHLDSEHLDVDVDGPGDTTPTPAP